MRLSLLLTFFYLTNTEIVHCTPPSNNCTPILYVATTDAFSSALAISTDLGKTWKNINPSRTSPRIYSIYAINNTVFVGTADGSAISQNSGQTWKISHKVMYGTTAIYVTENKIVAAICNFDMVSICFDSNLVQQSTDMGMNWTPGIWPIRNLCGQPTGVYLLGDRVFVTTSSTDRGGLAITDDGVNWRILNGQTGLSSSMATSIAGFGQNIYVGLDVDGGVISISQDGGETFRTKQTTPATKGSGVTSVFAAADGRVYVSTKGAGMAMSNSSVLDNWIVKTKVDGLASNSTTSIAAVGDTIIVGTPIGLSVSLDGGHTWTTKTTKDGLPQNRVVAVFANNVCGVNRLDSLHGNRLYPD